MSLNILGTAYYTWNGSAFVKTGENMNHGKVICNVCASVVRQCRCPEHHRNVVYGLCDSCRRSPLLKSAEEEAELKINDEGRVMNVGPRADKEIDPQKPMDLAFRVGVLLGSLGDAELASWVLAKGGGFADGARFGYQDLETLKALLQKLALVFYK